jgi:hypothetical protein
MVYISGLMEISSVFLALKDVFKETGVAEQYKAANDLVFALSFLYSRVWLTLASVVMCFSLYANSCWPSLSAMHVADYLIVYCTLLYCFLTVFWSFGITSKMIKEISRPKQKSL